MYESSMIRLLVLLLLFGFGCSKPDSHPTSGTHATFDPSAFGPREAPPNAPNPEPEVVDFGPLGDGIGINAVGQVRLRFSQPVVPLGTDEDVKTLTLSAEGVPVVGRAYWQSPAQLVFEASDELVPATRYDVAWTGTETLDPVSWSFETERPAAQLVDPSDRATHVARNSPLLISTTIATTAAELRSKVKVTVDGKPVAVQLNPASEEDAKRVGLPENMLFAVTHDPFPISASVAVSVDPGWRSSKGKLPAKKKFEGTFEVHPPLSVTAVTCEKTPGECPIQPLDVQLSTQLAEGQERWVSVRPKPPELEITSSSYDVRIDGRFVPGTTYELRIDRRIKDVFGQSLSADKVVKLDFEMPPPEVYLTRSSGQVLDDGKPHVGVSSRHVQKVRVRAAKVGVDTYREVYFKDRWDHSNLEPLESYGDVVEMLVDVRMRKPTNWGSTPIDLGRLLGDYRGPIILEVTGVDPAKGYEQAATDLGDHGLFHFGSLAPHSFVSTARSIVRVEDLATRKPVSNAAVSLLTRSGAAQKLGVTSGDGLLTTPGRPKTASDDLLLVRAPDGDLSMLPLMLQPTPSSASWLAPGEQVHAKLVMERGVYRPGDEVYVTGWAAVQTPHHPTGHRRLPGDVKVRLELVDRDDLVLDSVTVDNKAGRFWSKLTLPASARLGTLKVRAKFRRNGIATKDEAFAYADVKEFRTPEFEVKTTADKKSLIGKQSMKIDVESRYYSGSLAEIRDVRATRSCWTTSPPVVPGWELGVEGRWGGAARTPLTPKTVGTAKLELTDTPGPDDSGRTRRCDYSITVQNPSFQEEGAGEQVVVHPTPLYLGMSWWDDYPEEGDSLDPTFALFETNGERASAPAERLDVELLRIEQRPVYRRRDDYGWVSHYEDHKAETKKCTVRSDGKSSCSFGTLVPGEYELKATSRKNPMRRFERSFWISERWGDEDEPNIEVETATGELPTDKLTAVTVKTSEPRGVLIVERFGIIEAVPFETRRGQAKVSLKPTRSWAPGVTVTAYAIETSDDGFGFTSASADLDFDASHREIEVSVTAPKRASIRQKIDVSVDATDRLGKVSGRAAIWVADDAILDLTNYSLPDLVRAFYPAFVQDIDVRDQLHNVLGLFVPERWDPYTAVLSGYGLGGRGMGSGGGGLGMAGTPKPRADFRATPFFAGDVPVNDGKAQVSFTLPDNITRFRVLAVVSASETDGGPAVRFGSGESTIDVSAPLVVRPALPRFVRPGDAPLLAAVVQNTTKKAGKLNVRFELSGEAIQWQSAAPPNVTHTLAAESEVRIGFDSRVVAPGMTDVTVHTKFVPSDGSPPFSDAIVLPLESAPEPTLTQTVAMYGELDDDGATGIPVRLPDGVKSDVGGVSVTLTSTLLGGLRDATRNLVEYPYGCAEQTSSRMLPLVALSGLQGFVDATEIPNGQTIDEFVADGISRLISMQHSSGGFGYWPSSNSPNEYVSAYVTWVLWLAREAGHAVPDSVLNRALGYLNEVVKSPDLNLPDSAIYYDDLRRAIAVYTLAEAGQQPVEAVSRLLEREELPVFARAFALGALARMRPDDERIVDEVRKLTNKITETPGSASVVETPRYDLGAYFHSDLRSSAIALVALTRAKPDHAVIAKLARGLMAKRYKGAWRNTQENAYALVALADYAKHFEREEPNFEVKVWVDNAVLVDDRWSGRSSKSRTGTIPMPELSSLAARTADGTLPLNIRRRGDGRAYYRLAMTYAPTATDLPPIARGIEVRRLFRREGENPTDKMPTTLRAGEVFAIDVSVHNKALLRYVAIDLPVPAGLEPIDLGLGSRKTLPMGGTYGWWTSHVEHHDDRVVMFADTLQPGTHTRTVYLRATTPGEFSFPPTHAEAMYTPEVFGRSAGGTVEVKD